MNKLKQYLRYAYMTFSAVMCLLMLIGTVTLASPPALKPVEIDTSSLEEQVSQAQAERQAEESARARESAEMSAAASSAEASAEYSLAASEAAARGETLPDPSQEGQGQTESPEETVTETESVTETETQPETESESETEASETLSEKEKKKILSSVTAVGDSVMLGAADDIEDLIPDIVLDAKVSRQLRAAITVLKDLGRAGKLGETVVVAIGTNGVVSKSDAQDMVDFLGPDRTIYWIDCYGTHLSWQDRVNGIIEDIAEANDNVNVIHWSKLAKKHHEWLSRDGIHLRPRGRVAYAEMIYKALVHEDD
ncbi:MAG: hypothetical protein II627_02140 [Lachnospiraceae bacterium]|nr:hypothetical protein [Lachnospiraceae bacterium]